MQGNPGNRDDHDHGQRERGPAGKTTVPDATVIRGLVGRLLVTHGRSCTAFWAFATDG